ncbi:hypothetical protein BABINDRAFT_163841 [Babjeviella inositovora NRRL Y-12698]|uniref:Uncharacterized protein n=1 Tax=Babjeviella inositovora NRRL Y-12698 TaxID=984486 RepID=A0A1E3QHE5_9ASCO|nr:uncharacterized protein BABINDRAFT_163841 [Babjeviella inositovora NRRL Y-12698]ODQ77111.1 hypothetical protein BABINDRAFT_163841 [Babjeviella inositovora NRRL Y-12698]
MSETSTLLQTPIQNSQSSPVPQGEKPKKTSSRKKNRTSTPSTTPVPEDDSSKPTPKDFGLLEILKLIKIFKPLTIDGVPLDTIKTLLVQHVTSLRADPLLTTITLTFLMKPSDPEFLFDMDALHFRLSVPQFYQARRRNVDLKLKKPRINVLNEDVPRGYAINVERGFSTIAELALRSKNQTEDAPVELVAGKGLVSMVKTLDKYLESFLSEEKAETIKIVKFKRLETSPPAEIVFGKEKKKTKKAVTAKIMKMDVPLEVASLRQHLIDQFLTRLVSDKSIRLFKETEFESVYLIRIPKVSIPHPDVLAARDSNVPSKPYPPYAWKDGVLMRLRVPYNYGIEGLSIEFDRSATSKLSRLSTTSTAGMSAKEINSATAKSIQEKDALLQATKNCHTNFTKYASSAKHRSITEQVNNLILNLGWYCSDSVRYDEWVTLRQEMAK